VSRYEFSFVVTDVELNEEEKARVTRAIALAGASELGGTLPDPAVTAPLVHEEFIRRIWCGIPPAIELPEQAFAKM
jgi:hypothetical protein